MGDPIVYGDRIEWHSLGIDPDDLPSEEEPILVTIEIPHDGGRRVWMDVFMKLNDYGNPVFYTMERNLVGKSEQVMLWYKVLAWAYPPGPYAI